MILRKDDKVLVLGMTGRQGTFWSERMIACGTKLVGGVNPRKAGARHLGLPIHESARAAARRTPFDVAVMFVPPQAAGAAACDAIEAGARLLVMLTEHVPVQDVLVALAAARAAGARIIGPNTAGTVRPGDGFLGIMPAFNDNIFRPGTIGVVSRSGSLGALLCLNLVRAGFGISAFIGVGGDPIIGTSLREALTALDRDQRTEAMVLVGEIGGEGEEEVADHAAELAKPVVAFLAGAAAPPGRRMGHAGAIVSGARGSHAGKRQALERAGVCVLNLPSEVGPALRRALAG